MNDIMAKKYRDTKTDYASKLLAKYHFNILTEMMFVFSFMKLVYKIKKNEKEDVTICD